MTSDPRSIEASSSVADAAQLLRLEDVGSLPVVREGVLMGMLTDRDIVIRVVTEARDPRSTSVGEIASRDVESPRFGGGPALDGSPPDTAAACARG
jgi:CBS domain-containing protein